MSKTDKEYTIEIIIAYLNAWSSQNSGSPPINTIKLPELINSVYNAIHSLSDESK